MVTDQKEMKEFASGLQHEDLRNQKNAQRNMKCK